MTPSERIEEKLAGYKRGLKRASALAKATRIDYYPEDAGTAEIVVEIADGVKKKIVEAIEKEI